jgi:hypothetical protein
MLEPFLGDFAGSIALPLPPKPNRRRMRMTGDIRSQLLSSDAVNSLQMEARIAEAFTQSDWKVERSAYYTDPESGKIREIDVHASKVFDRPRRRRGIGAPLIHFEAFCECKSWNGSNIIFEASQTPESYQYTQEYWVGSEPELRKIVSAITEDAKLNEPARIQALYNYFVDRAYINGGKSFRHFVVMPLPPTDLVSQAYRETKSGKISDENQAEGKKTNPSWNAILSTLSATRAAEVRTRRSILSSLDTDDIKFLGIKSFLEGASFFFDAELMRYVFFHPFIVHNAKMWNLREGELSQVGSVRLFISNINGAMSYVDFVSEEKSEEYVKRLAAHSSASARKSILRLWQIIDALGWSPGQAEKLLTEVIRP